LEKILTEKRSSEKLGGTSRPAKAQAASASLKSLKADHGQKKPHSKLSHVQGEHVQELRQELTLSAHGRLGVTEYITVDFGVSGQPHFYRYVPTLYKRSGKLCNFEVYVKGVSDSQGHPLPYTSKPVQTFECITIGDLHTAYSGVHNFKLSYDLIGSVNHVSGQPELFYSALGPQWTMPVDTASITLALAANQAGQARRAVAYLGSVASKKHARLNESGGNLHISADKLAPGEDIILVLPLPAGSIAAQGLPDTLAEIYQTSQMIFYLPVFTTIFLILIWLLLGSDQRFGKAPTFSLKALWQPPQELTPAEAGTVIDESCDDKDIISTVIDLANRGYLAIRETPCHGLVGYGSKDYEFSQPPQPVVGALKAHEELLLNVIFTGRNKAYLSDMRGYFIDYMPLFRKAIQKQVTVDRYFARNPQADRDYFVNSGIFIGAMGALFYAYSVIATDTYKMASVGLIIAGALIFAASPLMPKRTRKGVAAVEQLHKFEHFIMSASDQEIAAALEQEPEIFYRLLPYTVVNGMGGHWAERFKNRLSAGPAWYTSIEQLEQSVGEGALKAKHFDSENFYQDVALCLKTINQVAVTKAERKNEKRRPTISAKDL
jgi:hypothetical protein